MKSIRQTDEFGDGDGRERRAEIRFDKAIPVIVESELFGASRGVCRNISSGGALVEMDDPMPLASFVTLRVQVPDSTGDISVLAEVKHHYCLNFGGPAPGRARGVGLRFVEFLADGADRWMESLPRHRVLH